MNWAMIAQNKANIPSTRIDITLYDKKEYENIGESRVPKNKANFRTRQCRLRQMA